MISIGNKCVLAIANSASFKILIILLEFFIVNYLKIYHCHRLLGTLLKPDAHTIDKINLKGTIGEKENLRLSLSGHKSQQRDTSAESTCYKSTNPCASLEVPVAGRAMTAVLPYQYLGSVPGIFQGLATGRVYL